MSRKSQQARQHRHERVRKRVVGTVDRPRLNVFRSDKHIYAQVIDDTVGHTLASASTVDLELQTAAVGKNKTEQAVLVGRAVAERAIDAGVKKVVFDRGGYMYHGRVKALADAAREAGLDF
ncbi:MAG: 50S ribosomal protein L18 [Anaerolineae bacterium]|nr:50S ribosomal protein L18 [Anaerolineae bacterium]